MFHEQPETIENQRGHASSREATKPIPSPFQLDWHPSCVSCCTATCYEPYSLIKRHSCQSSLFKLRRIVPAPSRFPGRVRAPLWTGSWGLVFTQRLFPIFLEEYVRNIRARKLKSTATGKTPASPLSTQVLFLSRFRPVHGQFVGGLARRPMKRMLPVEFSRIKNRKGWSARNTGGGGGGRAAPGAAITPAVAAAASVLVSSTAT